MSYICVCQRSRVHHPPHQGTRMSYKKLSTFLHSLRLILRWMLWQDFERQVTPELLVLVEHMHKVGHISMHCHIWFGGYSVFFRLSHPLKWWSHQCVVSHMMRKIFLVSQTVAFSKDDRQVYVVKGYRQAVQLSAAVRLCLNIDISLLDKFPT